MRRQATLLQVGCDHRSEMVHPAPNCLVGHRHSAFRQQIFDVAQAEGEPEVEPYCLVNDLGREPVSGVADFIHPLGYSATGRTESPTRRDNAHRQPDAGSFFLLVNLAESAMSYLRILGAALVFAG